MQDNNSIALKEIIDVQQWQKILDNFSAITDTCVRTVDHKGSLITKPTREPRLCGELLRRSPLRYKFCGACLPTFLGGTGILDKNLIFSCFAGLCNLIAPLRLNDDDEKVLGYIILGPVILVARKEREYYRPIAEDLHVDAEDFWNALLEIRVISFYGAQALVELIKDVGQYTIKLAYYKKQKEGYPPEKSRLDKLADALLDVAVEVTDADIGSVMLLDDLNKELTIRASKGLPREVIQETRLAPGEGIAGMAVKKGSYFLINDSLPDENIRPLLKRPYIKSSMTLPLKAKENILGVLNLAKLRTSTAGFDEHNLNLARRLIDLAIT